MLRNPVDFLTGEPLSFPDCTSEPNWHCSALMRSTPGYFRSSLTQSSCQDIAPAGCSCKNRRPASTCSAYRLQTNSRCTLALMSLRRTSSGSLLRLFSAYHAHHAVQHGDPISTAGFSVRIIVLAFSRFPACQSPMACRRRGLDTSGRGRNQVTAHCDVSWTWPS